MEFRPSDFDTWDDEFYWLLDHDLPLVKQAGPHARSKQIQFMLEFFGLNYNQASFYVECIERVE